jgi:histidinol-phosphate/aromatic aminotransferase/cobyric acid decarboxylase-like protein
MDNSEKMFELADRLKALRDEKKDAEQRVKELNAALDETDAALAQLMTDTETQNFTRSGTMFCLTNTTRASATADRKDELFEALRAEGYGGLVYETVNANSLSAFVRGQRSENDDVLPDWLEGLVSVFEKTTVGVHKAPRK